jgi:hypothetical protein
VDIQRELDTRNGSNGEHHGLQLRIGRCRCRTAWTIRRKKRRI